MSTVTKQYECSMPLYLKDIMDSTRSLICPDISIKFYLSDVIFMNGLFFYKCHSDSFVYKTKDNNHVLNLSDFKLCFECHAKVHISETYREKYLKACKYQNISNDRITKINSEITRINKIKKIIKNIVIHNLNYEKQTNKSHCRNVEKKITDNKSKTLFLYDLIKLTPERKQQIKNKIQSILNIVIKGKNPNEEIEQFYLYFTVCQILKSIDHYTNYLNSCITFINNDNFHANKKYCSFNDTLPGKIEEKITDIYSIEYHFRDYNTFAIDNTNKCKSNGCVLSNDRANKKWHLYPKNESDKCNSISIENINNFINMMKLYGDEGVDLLNIW
jgi:hypothetical protein